MSEKKPTLEELLSLKKCERPTDEEWAHFDEQLKSKMMNRLVGKQHNWGFPLKRMLAPFGAAAALTATVFSPEYFSLGDDTSAMRSSDSFVGEVSKTPLPRVDYSFSSNEIPAYTPKTSEMPVGFPMSAEQDASIRYVSNGVFSATTSDNVLF